MTDLELAVATLLHKTRVYNIYFDYYEGKHPLVYSQDRMKEIFNNLNARFTQNWCAVVVDSVMERLQLQRIVIADNDALTERLDALLTASELVLESDPAHVAALVTGEAYVLVWPDEEGQPEAYYNDPRNVHLFYQADRPRAKRFACKWWVGDDDYRYLTLYYPDRLEYYRSRNEVVLRGDGVPTTNEVNSGRGFELLSIEANPYAAIPVFHFRRDRRVIASELTDIVQPQDAINKLLADMMIAAEFGAFKQRWIISSADVGKLKNAPNQIWDIPAGDGEGQPTSVGEFDATPLTNYIEAIDKWVNAVAIISRTPKHYFFGQGGDPSGESLMAMEAPLNHKAQKLIDRFVPVWSEIAAFMLRLAGAGEIDDNAVVPVFAEPRTVQPYTQALIRKESVAAGVPLLWQMQQEGYTEQELADLQDARQQQQQEQMATLAATMVARQRQFDQEDEEGDGA